MGGGVGLPVGRATGVGVPVSEKGWLLLLPQPESTARQLALSSNEIEAGEIKPRNRGQR